MAHSTINVLVNRETILFTAGLAAFLHEVFFVAVDRPSVVYGSMAAMGVAAFLHGAHIVIGKVDPPVVEQDDKP